MVIFHCYVSLPEGLYNPIQSGCWMAVIYAYLCIVSQHIPAEKKKSRGVARPSSSKLSNTMQPPTASIFVATLRTRILYDDIVTLSKTWWKEHTHDYSHSFDIPPGNQTWQWKIPIFPLKHPFIDFIGDLPLPRLITGGECFQRGQTVRWKAQFK